MLLAGPAAEVYRPILVKFSERYPEISVEYTGVIGGQFTPKVTAEREAGQYLWDAYVGGARAAFRDLAPRGVIEPIKSALVLPEVLDDKNWIGGFDFGFQDKTRQFVYAFEATVIPSVWVNRDLVPESELNKLEQLIEPKWKGKVAWEDPRIAGVGQSAAGHLLASVGKDYVTNLYQNDAVLTSERRQLVEWVVRGTYPVAIGIEPAQIAPFLEQGLGKNVKGLEVEGRGGRMGTGWGNAMLFNRAPNPNTAKAFLNWLLTKDTQTAWVAATNQTNSRRVDVPGPKESAPTPNHRFTDDEPNMNFQIDAQELAKQLIK